VLTYLSVPLQALGSVDRDQHALLTSASAAAIGNLLGGTLTDRIGPIPTATLGLVGWVLALTLQSAALNSHHRTWHGRSCSPDLCWGLSGWAFYTAQVASIVRIEPVVATIALSLNASAMYLGFAIGGITGAWCCRSWAQPTLAGRRPQRRLALATLLVGSWQARLKPLKIAG